MIRYLSILLFILHFINASAQLQTAAETVSKYSIAQKRLLVLSTAAFTNLITQNSQDRDSIVHIASRITGIPLLIAYDEDYDSSSAGTRLLNAGKTHEAIELTYNLKGEQRIRLMSEIAMCYLYRDGRYKRDLDSAHYFIRNALALTDTTNHVLRYSCLALLGEYYSQAGKLTECKNIYRQLISTGRHDKNKLVTANAWRYLGTLDNITDSADFVYLNNALTLYEQLQLKEKQIELLWTISQYHIKHDLNLFKSDLTRILDLQQSIGYRHSLFAENFLSWVIVQQSKLYESLSHCNKAFENLNWSGLYALEGHFYGRLASCYYSLGNVEASIAWYKKGIEHGTQETHIFWYKNILYLAFVLLKKNQNEEALTMLQNVSRKFPPLTLWEKAQIYTSVATCSHLLKNDKLAEKNYDLFLRLLKANPGMDPYREFLEDYKAMVEFYLQRSDIKKARLVAEKGLFRRNASLSTDASDSYMLFKIDSAAGNYKSALDHYIQHKNFIDEQKQGEQKTAYQELTMKYGAEKKDNDIKLLQKEKQLQGTTLLQEKNTRNWISGALVLLLIIVGLLFYNSKLKQQTNIKLKAQGTEIENQNIELRHLVTEKDWLVKEIHHRVKNNFQTVMGLLGTQSAYLKNDIAINAINDSQRRIQSMSLIHQRLYQSNNLSAINMSVYIHELADSLHENYDENNHVRFYFDIDPIELDLAHCIPLGLILNEAITNSFKYAFPNNKHGEICISLKQRKDQDFLLTIKDNGTGLPHAFDINQTQSMGLNLMRGLCSEIGAQFNISGENGTQIKIHFDYQLEMAVKIAQPEIPELIESH